MLEGDIKMEHTTDYLVAEEEMKARIIDIVKTKGVGVVALYINAAGEYSFKKEEGFELDFEVEIDNEYYEKVLDDLDVAGYVKANHEDFVRFVQNEEGENYDESELYTYLNEYNEDLRIEIENHLLIEEMKVRADDLISNTSYVTWI